MRESLLLSWIAGISPCSGCYVLLGPLPRQMNSAREVKVRQDRPLYQDTPVFVFVGNFYILRRERFGKIMRQASFAPRTKMVDTL